MLITRGRLSAALIVVAASLSGCLLGLGSGVGFSINQTVSGTGVAQPENVVASGGAARITVSGTIVGKLPCDEIGGEVKESGRRVDLTITVRADRQFCNAVTPTSFQYVANLLNVGAGDRQLVVNHRYVGVDGTEGTRLDTVVVVN